MYNEQEFYNPKFFIKEETTDKKGNPTFTYRKNGNLYWELREKQDWSSLPRIFEDDCLPFF